MYFLDAVLVILLCLPFLTLGDYDNFFSWDNGYFEMLVLILVIIGGNLHYRNKKNKKKD